MPSSGEIRGRTFPPARLGYDIAAVGAFGAEVADAMADLEARVGTTEASSDPGRASQMARLESRMDEMSRALGVAPVATSHNDAIAAAAAAAALAAISRPMPPDTEEAAPPPPPEPQAGAEPPEDDARQDKIEELRRRVLQGESIDDAGAEASFTGPVAVPDLDEDRGDVIRMHKSTLDPGEKVDPDQLLATLRSLGSS
jgi:hypothetical protein